MANFNFNHRNVNESERRKEKYSCPVCGRNNYTRAGLHLLSPKYKCRSCQSKFYIKNGKKIVCKF